eukprot:8036048-Karenia_brevis.AAC.1
MLGLVSFNVIRAVTVEALECRTPWCTRRLRSLWAWHQRFHFHITEERWKGTIGRRINMSI